MSTMNVSLNVLEAIRDAYTKVKRCDATAKHMISTGCYGQPLMEALVEREIAWRTLTLQTADLISELEESADLSDLDSYATDRAVRIAIENKMEL